MAKGRSFSFDSFQADSRSQNKFSADGSMRHPFKGSRFYICCAKASQFTVMILDMTKPLCELNKALLAVANSFDKFVMSNCCYQILEDF